MATILLVEDEEQVRRIFQITLEREKHTVLTADNGSTAEEIIQKRHQEIDLLITDVSLPGASGIALADSLRELCADCKVMLISGYGEHMDVEYDYPMLAKPFTPQQLVSKIQSLLGDTLDEDL